MHIKEILKKWKKESKCTRIIQFRYQGGVLFIYTSQPGILIGLHGITIKKYRKIFAKELDDFKRIELVETDWRTV